MIKIFWGKELLEVFIGPGFEIKIPIRMNLVL